MTTNAIDRANADIDRLREQGYIDESLADRGRRFVAEAFDGDTVYASIAPIDDGDLSFYWRGGDMSLSIELGEDYGDTPWWSVHGIAGRDECGSLEDVGVFKHCLVEFSKEVERANPAWREQTW